MKTKKPLKLKRVGRTVRIDLPELELLEVEAKIDTGAYSSSIHISHAEEVQKEKSTILKAYIYENSHFSSNHKSFEFIDFSLKNVKSSNGIIEKRYVVKTLVKLKGKRIKTQFTLTDRSDMKYPILLGRKFLSKRFIVDVSKGINLKSLDV
jgi:hypothetical protein